MHCSSRIEEAEGRKNLYSLNPKGKTQRHQKWKIWITITMLLCKELILIRGQPPRQDGSPRATLDRGEFT